MKDLISYKGIEKAFGKKEVLEGIDLSVGKGETLVILGGSGSGKSVLLKITIGLMYPDAGRLLIDGEDATDYGEREWLEVRKKISYMFQWGALFDSMNVYDNVAFPLREQRVDEAQIKERISDALDTLGLEGTEAVFPHDLSGGMRKRVALARSIISKPECILYDEPTAGLDPVTSDQINSLIRKTQEKFHVTSVVVTHDIRSMAFVADKVAFLYEGRIAFSGTLEEAKKSVHPVLKEYLSGRV
ncbi:MAG TPA: ATP-binding cassette domain-containing protein [Acidobacteriota bacterium]|jgi:phospholipid/cholesterol/gamma-HCH transport system ATP-binding protein|nr:ATP-binding cassette domain-containing protein [Acidobacteriota bacterium]HNT16609.1 ATP-binding cassette domain-containing protein [Acidobacteriota bacterium]HPA26688.1 ATP-binding cassette domain-containing protein [Acidobacteriota bacterium]HQO19954.1 ATP-binding cassette domain-containing protein [Acidobacteriota bacterium]HQQ46793.1 ATP-binding cassette domain-containing protein [Acidobacteriota bacterium]